MTYNKNNINWQSNCLPTPSMVMLFDARTSLSWEAFLCCKLKK